MPEKNADPGVPRGGFGAVTDPDEAVKVAVKVATEAGQYELAAQLLDVLMGRPKQAAIVRLETVKGGR